MVKQKIVIKLTMEDARKRSKALQIAVSFNGVQSASLGEDNIEVIGDGVDSVALTKAFRKRMRFADLISVGEDKSKPDDSDAAKWCVEPTFVPYNWSAMQCYYNNPYVFR